MRKHLLFISLSTTLFSLSSNAQFQKGDRIIGAGFGISSSKQIAASGSIPVENRNTGLNISFDYGYAKMENRLSGFYINTGYSMNKTNYSTQPAMNRKEDGYNTGAGFFTKRYRSIGKNFFLFAEGRIGANYSVWNYSNNVYSKEKTYGISAGIYPGIAFRHGKRLLLELRFADFANIGYSYSENKMLNSNNKEIRKSFNAGSSLGLGYLSNFGIGGKWIIPAKSKTKK